VPKGLLGVILSLGESKKSKMSPDDGEVLHVAGKHTASIMKKGRKWHKTRYYLDWKKRR
jgi:hypothetical protein